MKMLIIFPLLIHKIVKSHRTFLMNYLQEAKEFKTIKISRCRQHLKVVLLNLARVLSIPLCNIYQQSIEHNVILEY